MSVVATESPPTAQDNATWRSRATSPRTSRITRRR
jgi:hypothetical protein